MAPAKRATRGGRRRPYHHGDLRRALLDEALAIIRDDGVGELTLRGIGARLGVSRTALYRHFADKRALLAAVATEGFRALRQELVGAWEADDHGPAAFRAMGVAYVRFALSSPAHYRVMFGGFVDPQAERSDLTVEAEGAFQALVDAVAALQREAVLRRDDPVLMARYIWALVHGIAMLGIDGQLRDPGAIEALMRSALDWLGAGIAAEPGVVGRFTAEGDGGPD